MTYAEEAFNYLMRNKRCTHKEIAIETLGNCSYSIIRDMLALCKIRGIEVKESWEKNKVRPGQHKVYEVA